MNDPLQAAALLLILEGLFALRVAGQLLVRLRGPASLPPMEEWASGLVPYPLLLGIQIVTLVLMTGVALGIALGWPPLGQPRPVFGDFLVVVAVIYAVSTLVRYVVRMALRPEQRWLGGTIPMAAHLVLAAWLLVLGTYFQA